jgi:hypothetical protein
MGLAEEMVGTLQVLLDGEKTRGHLKGGDDHSHGDGPPLPWEVRDAVPRVSGVYGASRAETACFDKIIDNGTREPD